MTDTMSINDYLAQGGVLTSPANVPPRYRAELMKIMATFVDSELAGAAGFAEIINDAPGIRERIAAAKIVMEKTDNAGRVLRLMGDFGADTTRYANHHPWAQRLNRSDDIDAGRAETASPRPATFRRNVTFLCAHGFLVWHHDPIKPRAAVHRRPAGTGTAASRRSGQ